MEYLEKHRAAALAVMAERARDAISWSEPCSCGADCPRMNGDDCDSGSPIERAFWLGLICRLSEEQVNELRMVNGHLFDPSIRVAFENGQVRVSRTEAESRFRCTMEPQVVLDSGRGYKSITTAYPQCHVGRYRADFVLSFLEIPESGMTLGTPMYLAVECDGHEYHEKTKEQARRDKARDRAFQAAGLPVFRYTGSELAADPTAAARECFKFLHSAWWDALEAEFRRRKEDR